MAQTIPQVMAENSQLIEECLLTTRYPLSPPERTEMLSLLENNGKNWDRERKKSEIAAWIKHWDYQRRLKEDKSGAEQARRKVLEQMRAPPHQQLTTAATQDAHHQQQQRMAAAAQKPGSGMDLMQHTLKSAMVQHQEAVKTAQAQGKEPPPNDAGLKLQEIANLMFQNSIHAATPQASRLTQQQATPNRQPQQSPQPAQQQPQPVQQQQPIPQQPQPQPQPQPQSVAHGMPNQLPQAAVQMHQHQIQHQHQHQQQQRPMQQQHVGAVSPGTMGMSELAYLSPQPGGLPNGGMPTAPGMQWPAQAQKLPQAAAFPQAQNPQHNFTQALAIANQARTQ